MEKVRSALYHECLKCGHEYAPGACTVCPTDNSELVPVYGDLLLGTVLNEKYQVLALCGSGASGRVYRARHIALKKDVAIKFLHQHLLADEEKIARFENEARTLSDLSHANIVKVLDFGTVPQPYLVMEYACGQRLDQVLQTVGPFPPPIAIKVFAQICAGVAAVHDRGMVHQDLKPSNIIVTKLETDVPEVKILDFGTAKLLEGDSNNIGEVVGSPPYMSPEQCAGTQVDARSDIYSLGCVMYQLLTGVKPFTATTNEEYFYKHLNQLPEPPSKVKPELKIPIELDRIVCRALSKQVDFRLQSMAELEHELRSVTFDSLTSAPGASSANKLKQKANLPTVLPGLLSVLAAFIVNNNASPLLQPKDATVQYLLYVKVLLCLFPYGYWVYVVAQLGQVNAPQRWESTGKKTVLFLMLSALPLGPLTSLAALIAAKAALGTPLEWGVFLLYTAFLFLCGLKFIAPLLTPESGATQEATLRQFCLSLFFLIFTQTPAIAAPLLATHSQLATAVLMNCWLLSYFMLGLLIRESELTTAPGLRTPRRNLYAQIALIVPPMALACNLMLPPSTPAIETLSQIIKAEPDNNYAYIARGAAYQDAHEDRLALNDYAKTVQLQPNEALAWRTKGDVLYDLKRIAEAAACYDHNIQHNGKSDQDILRRGNCYDRLGRWQEALADYAQAYALAKESNQLNKAALALENSGATKFKMGNYAGCIADTTKAISIKDDAVPLYWRAKAKWKAKQYDLALKDCELLVNDKDNESGLSLASMIRAEMLANKGDYKNAHKEIETALQIWPDYKEMMRQDALILMRSGDFAQALTMAKQGLEGEVQSRPHMADMLDSYYVLAQVRLSRGELEQALNCCNYSLGLCDRKELRELKDRILLEKQKCAQK